MMKVMAGSGGFFFKSAPQLKRIGNEQIKPGKQPK